MITRRVDYLFQEKEGFELEVSDSGSLLRYAIKNSEAIAIYDVIELNEDDDDQTLVRFVAVKIANREIEVDFDDDSDDISTKDSFEEIKRVGPAEATVEKLWENTFIPTLCQEFTTEELNSFVLLSIELS
jgi:hypothetical protein